MVRAGQYGLLFVTSLIVARSLGPAGRAEYAMPLALASTLWTLIHLSVDAAAGRMLARREASLEELGRFLSAATVGLGGLGALGTLAVGFLAADTLLAGASRTTVILAAALVPCLFASMAFSGLLLRMGAVSSFGWISAAGAAVQLGSALALELGGGLTPERAMLATLAGTGVAGVAMSLAVARRTRLRVLIPSPSRSTLRRAVFLGLALHGVSVGLFLNLRIDLFLVSGLTSVTATGLYTLSVTLAELLYATTSNISQAALRAQTEDESEVAARYTLAFDRQAGLLALLLLFVTWLGAYPLVIFSFGSSWAGSVVPLMILAVASVALTLEAPPRIHLTRIGRPIHLSLIAGAAGALNVALNLALIPLMGITGAALGSLLSYWCHAALVLWLFSRATGLGLQGLVRRPGRGDEVVRLFRRLVTVSRR